MKNQPKTFKIFKKPAVEIAKQRNDGLSNVINPNRKIS